MLTANSLYDLLDNNVRVILDRVSEIRALDPELMLVAEERTFPVPDRGTSEKAWTVSVLPRHAAFETHRAGLRFLDRAEFWVERAHDEIFLLVLRDGVKAVGVWTLRDRDECAAPACPKPVLGTSQSS